MPADKEPLHIPLAEQTSEVRAELGRTVSEKLESTPGVQIIPVNPEKPAQLYGVAHFLSQDECDDLIARIDANAYPSTLFEGSEENYRTSASCNLNVYDPVVAKVEKRIADLLGIDPALGEPLQGQRYQPGQFYKSHEDFFYIDQPYWPETEKRGGQRTWTAMIYLNQPELGGGTGFTALGFQVIPRPGWMLIWNNMNP
ncbi:MAG: prolyl hydroxylase family protein, partial [Sphingomicrobium sp.]